MITPEGFEVKPFVTEEQLNPEGIEGNILDVQFDAQGRAWIAVTLDYPNELGEGRDKIVVCEDTDGDGVADDITVFADGLSIPLNMVLTEQGVITIDLGEFDNDGAVVHLQDTTGNDEADTREELFSGFSTNDTHAGPNKLEWGIDNWVWGQVGYAGFNGEINGESYGFSSSIFRFKPDGDLNGNQAGIGFNERGQLFASAATSGQPSNFLAIPQSYYQFVNGWSDGTSSEIHDSNRILNMTDRVRWGGTKGGYTAATGHEIYTARKTPKSTGTRPGSSRNRSVT